MILTDHFVFLQMPRTGTTFTEEALIEHLPSAKSYYSTPSGEVSKHNHWGSIPFSYQGLPLYGTLREPCDLWASWFVEGLHEEIIGGLGICSFEDYYSSLNLNTQYFIDIPFDGKYGFFRKYYKEMFGPELSKVNWLNFSNLGEEVLALISEFNPLNGRDFNKAPLNEGRKRMGRPYSDFISEAMEARIKEEEKWTI